MISISCSQQHDNRIIDIIEERDSLKKEVEFQGRQLSDINRMISTINTALDSIAGQEEILFHNNSDTPYSRSQALNDLQRYETVLRQQQKRIEELSANIDPAAEGMIGIVENLKLQLSQKDQLITKLRNDIRTKDFNIARLREQVTTQQSEIAQQQEEITVLGEKNEAQHKALVYQDKAINTCYVLIGSKGDLKRKGIIKKNRIVPASMLDKSKFAAVDIRKWHEITFEAKRPRIITDMPQAAYTITTRGKHEFTLRIIDPTVFWSISNYLVIQTD